MKNFLDAFALGFVVSIPLGVLGVLAHVLGWDVVPIFLFAAFGTWAVLRVADLFDEEEK